MVALLAPQVPKNSVEKLTDGVYVIPGFRVDACSEVPEEAEYYLIQFIEICP